MPGSPMASQDRVSRACLAGRRGLSNDTAEKCCYKLWRIDLVIEATGASKQEFALLS
jgi:hypothetical protein